MNKAAQFYSEPDQISPSRILKGLFVHRDAIERHHVAPMLPEREAYLRRLLEVGHKRDFLTERASMLLHVVRAFEPNLDGLVCEAVIAKAARSWAAARPGSVGHKREAQFKSVSRSWLRFLGILRPERGGAGRFEDASQEFSVALERDLGYLPATSRSCMSAVSRFLRWASGHRESVMAISQADIDDFLVERVAGGWSHRTCVNETRSLRVFFRYAERRGWSNGTLSATIRAPRMVTCRATVRCPPWTQVRSMLASLDSSKPSHCRARAILLLASVYGLRRSELVRLTLEDLDWQNEVLTVRRSKRGRLQQLPLQHEVGEAIILYLRQVRPPSRFRNLFLTLHRPHRPATNLGNAMRKVMDAQNTFERSWGLHSLRHACATELLRKGTTLQGIADFLGHRGLQSVSIYAHCDFRSLRRVADIDLAGVL